MVDTRFNISKGLSGSQIVRPAGDEKPGIKFVWPKLYSTLSVLAHSNTGQYLNEDVEFKIPSIPMRTHSRNASSP